MKFLNYINEAKREDTAIYVGRFQGLTLGHLAVIKNIAASHNNGYIIIMKGAKTSLDKKRNPFPLGVQQEMFSKVAGSKFKIMSLSGSFVDAFLKSVEEGKIKGNNFVLYSGPDRLEPYNKLKRYFKEKGLKLTVVNTEQMVQRIEGVSGTKFREALVNNDYNSFKKIAPQPIWSMFKKLQEYL